ncbi:molecular chaperone DnaJ [Marinomonas sp. UCMA 3892]|uniref:J domain-containing protein n=1 Tax=Marinomonas sp. UCMA 3892 TaxID=1972585 RepID=UPI00146D8F36|nr:molecular chaperone DnaJ [Marinomonas sp. UCMA 3892]NLV00505.1 molecular chaperone DnaJ [Marinomonas sp. UCMA 3892]
MNHWEVLGIEPTKDKRVIKLAYTELLKKNSPTEFPEEFKNLRKAFELATKEAKKLEKAESQSSDSHHEKASLTEESCFTEKPAFIEEDTFSFEEADSFEEAFQGDEEAQAYTEERAPEPIELGSVDSIESLQMALHELYRDVQKRSDVEQWKRLFSSPIFWQVDQSQSLSICLLEFFSAHFFLPEDVFSFIDGNLKITGELSSTKNSHQRDMALALSIYIKSLPLRVGLGSHRQVNADVPFDKFLYHLQLRNYIENKCLYDNLEKSDILQLAAKILPEFKEDFALYEYMTKWLWSLDGYQEIHDLLDTLEISESAEDLLNYQAHAVFKIQDYHSALSLYLKIDQLDRDFLNTKLMFKDIGLCYLHLKEYEKAYFYLASAVRMAFTDIDIRAALTTARRLYIKELQKDEEANVIEIAQLQYQNGRYQDALTTTQNYHRTFVSNNNYLQALCLAKLGQLDDAFLLFQSFFKQYKRRQLCTWPLIVDLVEYCSELITFEYLFEDLMDELETDDFSRSHEVLYQPGSVKEVAYSERESAVLELSIETKKPSCFKEYWDFIYRQEHAWAVIMVLRATLADYDDPSVAPELRQAALAGINEAMPKVKHNPKWVLPFLNIAYIESDYDKCFNLCDICISAYPNIAAAYYYKGRSFADLEKYEHAVPLLELSAQKFGNQEYGVYSLQFAIECCEKLIENGQPFHNKYTELSQQLKTMKEVVGE